MLKLAEVDEDFYCLYIKEFNEMMITDILLQKVKETSSDKNSLYVENNQTVAVEFQVVIRRICSFVFCFLYCK